MNSTESTQPTFAIGDKVTSTREGGLPGLAWDATVIKVMRAKCKTPDGYAYETLGMWRIVDAAKVGGWFKQEKRPTLRQLWSSHLIKA